MGAARGISWRRRGDCGRSLPSLGCDGPRLSASRVDWGQLRGLFGLVESVRSGTPKKV